MSRSRSAVDRAAVGLALLAFGAAATTLASGELDAFRLRGWGVVVTLGLGALAGLAGWWGQRRLVLLSGLGFLASAGVQIVQLGGEAGAVEHGVLGGNAATFALWLALGIGLTVLGVAGDPAAREAAAGNRDLSTGTAERSTGGDHAAQ